MKLKLFLAWIPLFLFGACAFKSEENNCLVIDCTEEYTSKTCTRCGEINNIGSLEIDFIFSDMVFISSFIFLSDYDLMSHIFMNLSVFSFF
jgi:hypothetical protein